MSFTEEKEARQGVQKFLLMIWFCVNEHRMMLVKIINPDT